MPDLVNPRGTGRGASIKTNWWRVSGTNHEKDGTWRVGVDFWNSEADFIAGIPPLESEQFQGLTINGILNGLENSVRPAIDG